MTTEERIAQEKKITVQSLLDKVLEDQVTHIHIGDVVGDQAYYKRFQGKYAKEYTTIEHETMERLLKEVEDRNGQDYTGENCVSVGVFKQEVTENEIQVRTTYFSSISGTLLEMKIIILK